MPRPALGSLQAPIHYVSGGGVFPGSKAAEAWSWPIIFNYNIKNK